MGSWEDIFWEVDNWLSKYPFLDHWRYAWNKIFTTEVLRTSEGRKKYPKLIKYLIAGAIALVIFILYFAISFAGVCCMSVISLTSAGGLLSLPAGTFISLIASFIVGPLLSGLMTFFYKEEYNQEGDPSLALMYISSPKYRRYLLSAASLFFLTSALAMMISFILSLPFLLIKVGVVFFSGTIYLTVFLTLWFYLSFFLVERVEALIEVTEEEEEKKKEGKVILEVEESQEGKEVLGVGVELSKEEAGEGISLEDVVREGSFIKEELKETLKKVASSGFHPLLYSLERGLKAILMDIQGDRKGNILKVLLSAFLSVLSLIAFIAPFAFSFPLSAISSYRIIRKGAKE